MLWHHGWPGSEPHSVRHGGAPVTEVKQNIVLEDYSDKSSISTA